MKNSFTPNFKTLFSIFTLLIICLLLEGVYYFYYNEIMNSLEVQNHVAKSGYNPIIWKESGFVENLQVFFLLLSISLILFFVKIEYSKLNKVEKILVFFYFLSLTYYLMEEISWGQHIFGWRSPNFFLEINHQRETNIHNTSSVFNELPRNLLLIWCSSTFLWIQKIPLKNRFLQKFIFPNTNLKYISILILFIFLPDFLIKKLDFLSVLNEFKTLIHIITFNFVRLSELEELLFTYYILNHSYYMAKFKL